MALTCGALGSPYGLSGCVAPGQYGSPSVRIKRIKAYTLNLGGFCSTLVSHQITRPLQPGSTVTTASLQGSAELPNGRADPGPPAPPSVISHGHERIPRQPW